MSDPVPDEPPRAQRPETIDDWIALPDCEDGRLYRVECRNAQWGIFHARNNGFLIARAHSQSGTHFNPETGELTEFNEGDYYESLEYHWDVDQPHGSAKPLRCIEAIKEPDFELLKTLPDARRGTSIKHKFDAQRLKEADD